MSSNLVGCTIFLPFFTSKLTFQPPPRPSRSKLLLGAYARRNYGIFTAFNSDAVMALLANARIIIDNSDNDSIDKIKEYTLEIRADAMSASENKPQYYCWHFDRHKNTNNENLVHPYYHLQFGGDFLKDKEFGKILHFKAP